MGYNTDFDGSFEIDRKLEPSHCAYLKRFSETRRMARHYELAELLDDPFRKAVGLPIGDEGEFFVGASDDFLEWTKDSSIIDHNRPPRTQPGLWCQWVPNEEGTAIEWDGGEKFYYYIEWITYLIDNFIGPWGYVLNGTVQWYGEDRDDIGMIIIKDNTVSVKTAKLFWDNA